MMSTVILGKKGILYKASVILIVVTLVVKIVISGSIGVTNRNQSLKTQSDKLKSAIPFIANHSEHRVGRLNTTYNILFLDFSNWFIKWSKTNDTKHCEKYTNCKLTFNKSMLEKSNAVVFDLHSGSNETSLLQYRKRDQVWVFFTLESPLRIANDYKRKKWQNVFNLSWTYQPKSDIFTPYGVITKTFHVPQRNYSDIFRKKSKFAAWVVSNCKTPSKRNAYIEILKQFVDIDVFGHCGKRAPKHLEKYLSEHYKFYLSFENSLCVNYMTEKFFHYYQLDVITVLRGHNNYSDYVPDTSYIDTANFSSISALAKFMKDLGGNEDKYVSYLKEKDKYTITELTSLYKDAVCQLCEKINTIEKNKRTYEDIVNWLGPCYEANDLIKRT